MDDDMKELHHDNYPSQSEMQEWLEANREIYTDFKSKIQSILKNLSRGFSTEGAYDWKINSIQKNGVVLR